MIEHEIGNRPLPPSFPLFQFFRVHDAAIAKANEQTVTIVTLDCETVPFRRAPLGTERGGATDAADTHIIWIMLSSSTHTNPHMRKQQQDLHEQIYYCLSSSYSLSS